MAICRQRQNQRTDPRIPFCNRPPKPAVGTASPLLNLSCSAKFKLASIFSARERQEIENISYDSIYL